MSLQLGVTHAGTYEAACTCEGCGRRDYYRGDTGAQAMLRAYPFIADHDECVVARRDDVIAHVLESSSSTASSR